MTSKRFMTLWDRCRADGVRTVPLPVYEELLRRYEEPHRYYHTPDHINHCLRQLDLAANLMDDADAVEMGLWFHDAIYDPRASDNERESAELFTRLLGNLVKPAFRRSVYDLILVTAHPEQPKCLDEQFMVDIDLSSFALPWEDFKRDSDAVRKEFAHLPDKRFFTNHLAFLRALMGRPTFFFTDFFRDRCETAARENVTRYMADVRAQGYA
ncbi:MAG: hypothetical protein ACE5H7_04060 [Acidiferrobacterales bacterium]